MKSPVGAFGFILLFACLFLVCLFVFSVRLKTEIAADEECRARAKDPNNVTLCRGEVYATKAFGEITCGCREAE